MAARRTAGEASGVVAAAQALCLGWACAVAPASPAPAAEDPVATLREFLTTKGIDAPARAALAAGAPWGDAEEETLVRVLARLPAPDTLVAAWRREVEPLAEHGLIVDDRLVLVEGRATFVAPLQLSAEAAVRAGRPAFDVVRIVDGGDVVIDVVVPQAPRKWARWQPLDEPATVLGLPLAAAAGPMPRDDAPDHRWPDAAAEFVVAATDVAWRPAGLFGQLGMNFALFDGVVDDRKLEAGDAAAFWAALAAVRGVSPAEVARAAGAATDIVPLIDPQRDWFAMHRGAPVLIDGVARRATRIAIDDPLRREQVAADHYWELEVFVDTPPLSVDGHVQDRYPVVCCVRELPAGMPAGETISERVRVPGFAFKRYRYPLSEVLVDGVQELPAGTSRAVPLVVAPRAEWLVPQSPRGLSAGLFWVFSGIIATVAALLAANGFAMARDARRSARLRCDALPERIDLPSE